MYKKHHKFANKNERACGVFYEIFKKIIICMSLLFFFTTLNICNADNNKLLIATTTSVEDTGLLDLLKPIFFKDTGIELLWVSTGSGLAIKMGISCSVDMLFTHDPKNEENIIKNGIATERVNFLYNHFILVGPFDDKLRLENLDLLQAFSILGKNISNNLNNPNNTIFVSRGDNSGTHNKEMEIWDKSKIDINKIKYKSKSYVEAGSGMLMTLKTAAELGAYTLTDEATFNKYLRNSARYRIPKLKIIIKDKKYLINNYSLIFLDHNRCKNIAYKNTQIFKKWILSEKIKNVISNFKILNNKVFYIKNIENNE